MKTLHFPIRRVSNFRIRVICVIRVIRGSNPDGIHFPFGISWSLRGSWNFGCGSAALGSIRGSIQTKKLCKKRKL
jgi:hypothetical protein